MSDDWDEIFAMAEGKAVAAAEEEEEGVPSESSNKNKRKQAVHTDNSYEAYLLARCDSVPTIDTSLLFSRSFACQDSGSSTQQQKPVCKRWKGKTNGTRCRRCQGGPGEHLLLLQPSSCNNPLLHVYATVRNIRCWCRVQLLLLLADTTSSTLNDVKKSMQRPSSRELLTEQSKLLQEQLQQLQSSSSSRGNASELPPIVDTSRILLHRIRDVVQVNNNHEDEIETTASLPYRQFERLVRCVMACDAVYYQAYYATITTTPTAKKFFHSTSRRRNDDDETVQQQLLLPHPVTYFGEWQIKDTEQLNAAISTTTITNDDDAVKQAFGLLVTKTTIADYCDTDSVEENVLATLHRLRLTETVALFQGWMTTNSSTRYAAVTVRALHDALAKSVHDPNNSTLDERHSTVAPPLLSEWRDSCRNFLCHLYSYATVSNQTIRLLHERLRADDGGGCHHCILEVGAGTGFLAHVLLLHTTGGGESLAVTAYDSAPNATNEYHAATPPFVNVQQGHAISKQLWRNHSNNDNSNLTALLLCYPPPDSPMAYQAVRNFVKHCCAKKQQQHQRLLIHIGEFKGLTGNCDFETYLTDNFVCTDRWPCLTWGTDAAAVTVWKWQRPSDHNNNDDDDAPIRSLLLPCVHCQAKESVRRCRLLRILHYCSRKCCEGGADARRQYLALSMIDLGDTIQLDFDNDQHFSKLL